MIIIIPMCWLRVVLLFFTILPFVFSLRCHLGHYLAGHQDYMIPSENVTTTVECLEEDIFCLRVEAMTSWFTFVESMTFTNK